jgi:hypothetical protein
LEYERVGINIGAVLRRAGLPKWVGREFFSPCKEFKSIAAAAASF